MRQKNSNSVKLVQCVRGTADDLQQIYNSKLLEKMDTTNARKHLIIGIIMLDEGKYAASDLGLHYLH